MKKAALIAMLFLGVPVLGLAVLTAAAQEGNRNNAANFSYQCQGVLGASLGESTTSGPQAPTAAAAIATTTGKSTPPLPAPATTTTATPKAATRTTSSTPTTNPFASMSIPSDAPPVIARCASAVSSAPYQAAALTTAPSDPAQGAAAATYAQRQLGLPVLPAAGSLDGPTNGGFSDAGLIRYALYQATGHSLILPAHAREQIAYGQRVAPTAIAAGDLIFSDFASNGPRRVAIALDGYRMITANLDDTTSSSSAPPTTTATQPAGSSTSATTAGPKITLTSTPAAGENVIVKRVLPYYRERTSRP